MHFEEYSDGLEDEASVPLAALALEFELDFAFELELELELPPRPADGGAKPEDMENAENADVSERLEEDRPELRPRMPFEPEDFKRVPWVAVADCDVARTLAIAPAIATRVSKFAPTSALNRGCRYASNSAAVPRYSRSISARVLVHYMPLKYNIQCN